VTTTAKPDTATVADIDESIHDLRQLACEVDAMVIVAGKKLSPQVLRVVNDLTRYAVDGMRRARGVIQQVHGS
jgi:hypothetical protein